MAAFPIIAGILAGGWLGGDAAVRSFDARAGRYLASQISGAERKVRVRSRTDLGALFGHVRSTLISASQFETEGLPLFCEPQRSQRGYLNRLRMDLRNFRLSGLRVERLTASIPACRFDLGQAKRGSFIITRSGSGTGTVQLLARDLGEFIRRKFPQVKSATVTIQGGRVRVVGEADVLVLRTTFEVDAAVMVRDGTQLHLSDPKILLEGKPAPTATGAALLRILNPVVDLDRDLKLHGAISVTGLKLENDQLVATGTTKIPVRPKPN